MLRRFLLVLFLLAAMVIAEEAPQSPLTQRPNKAEAASGATAVVPLNYNLDAGPAQVGPGPANYDFSTAGCAGWSKVVGSWGCGGVGFMGVGANTWIKSSGYTLTSNIGSFLVTWRGATSGDHRASVTLRQGTVIVGGGDIGCNPCADADWHQTWLGVNNSVQGQSVRISVLTGGATIDIDEAGTQWIVAQQWKMTASGEAAQPRSDATHGNFIEIGLAYTNWFQLTGSNIEFDYGLPGMGDHNLDVRLYRSDGLLIDSFNITCTACTRDWTRHLRSVNPSYIGSKVQFKFTSLTGKTHIDNVGINLLEAQADPRFPSEWSGEMDTSSGQVFQPQTDIEIPGKGVPPEFTRYYQGMLGYQAGLGSNWTHTYSWALRIDSDNSVTVRYPSGGASYFKYNSGTFTAPTGVYDTLVKNGDNTYTLTSKAQVQYNFDTAGKLTSIADRNGWTTSVSYNGSGFLSSVTDPGSRSLTFTTDASGRITQISDPMSPARTVVYAYDANTDLTSATDLGGGVTSFTYSNHRMTSISSPLRQALSTAESGAQCGTAGTGNGIDDDSDGRIDDGCPSVLYVYDAANRLREKTEPLGGKTCTYFGFGPSYTSSACPGVTPSAAEGQTIVVDALGKKATYDFDTKFRTSSVTDHDGFVTSQAFDSSNNRTCVIDPLSHRTGYTYGTNGNVTGVIDANNTDANCNLAAGGVKWTYTYTAKNDVDLATDPLGRQTDYVYDANGNLIQQINKDNAGATKLLTCMTRPTSGTDKGLVTEVIASTNLTDCTGNKTKLTYNSSGYVTDVVNPRFSSQGTPPKTTMTYDTGGRLLTTTNELGHSDTFTYDNQNRVLTNTDNLGNVMAQTYDANGNARTVTDPNRKAVGTAESGAACGAAGTGNGADDDGDGTIDDGCPNAIYVYDSADRVIAVIDALGKTTAYAYDAKSNLVSLTNANRQVVGTPESGAQCGASGTGNGVDEDSDGKADDGCPSVKYAYTNFHGLLSETDALGNVWTQSYDAARRVTGLTDAKGQAISYSYNNRNDRTLIDYPVGTTDVSFQYDAVQNRTQMVDATGTTTYVYDALNRMTSVTFPGSRTVGYSYSNAGNRASITYPGGSNQVTYGYDEANNLTSVTDWNSQQTVYAYNNAGYLSTATLPASTGIVGSYTYNNADNLTGISWVKGGSQTLASASYTLDATGTRKQRVDGLGTHTYTYDAAYRLTGVTYPGPSSDSYSYDGQGNRLTKNATSFTYDAADRLTSTGGVSYVNDNNGNRTSRGADSFAWDAANRMTSATVGGATTTIAYRGDSLRDSLTTGGNTTTFTWDIAAGMPQVLDDGAFKYVYGLGRIAEVSGSATNYYLADAQDSVMALTNSTGTVLNTYNYDVFGAIRSSTGSQANPFTFTGEPTDASTGLEYLRARYYDPATGGFASRDQVATSNRFNYVDGDPVNLVDPSGQCLSQKAYDDFQRKGQEALSKLGSGWLEQILREAWLAALKIPHVCNRDYNPDPPRPTPTPRPPTPEPCVKIGNACYRIPTCVAKNQLACIKTFPTATPRPPTPTPTQYPEINRDIPLGCNVRPELCGPGGPPGVDGNSCPSGFVCTPIGPQVPPFPRGGFWRD